MYRKFLMLCGLCFGIMSTFCFGFEHSQQPPLDLKLSLQKVDLAVNDVIVQLTVMNTGRHRIVIPHLREGLIERHGMWWGWGIVIKNHYNTPFSYFSIEHRPPRLKNKDLIELQPAEHFTVTVNIADTIPRYYYLRDRQQFDPSSLAHMDGAYEVRAFLRLFKSNTPGWFHNILWMGEVESNTLTIPIIHEKRRMYFPGRLSRFVSPDGQSVIINVDSESEEHALSLGGKHVLYLHNIKTDEQEKIYTYDEHVEVLWSLKGDKVLINDYGESTDCRYYSDLLIFFLDRRELISVKDQLYQKMGNEPHIFGNRCVRIMGTKWLSENVLKMRIQGYGEVDPGSFRQWYEYHLLDEEFRRLEYLL